MVVWYNSLMYSTYNTCTFGYKYINFRVENFHSVILIVHIKTLIISRIFVQFTIVNIPNPILTHDIILQGEHGKIDGFEFRLH